MNDLRDRMRDSVDSRHTDVARLVEHAVRAGTTLRRRRRAAVVGSVVAVGALTVCGAAAGGLLDGRDRADVVAGSSPASSSAAPVGSPGSTPSSAAPSSAAPSTERKEKPAAHAGAPPGRDLASALLTAVQQVRPGAATEFRGQPEYAEFAFTADDSPGAGAVGVNVQDWAGEQAELAIGSCLDWMAECELSGLPDGSRVRLYVDRTEVDTGTGIRSVAERLTPKGVRIIASAANGFQLPASRFDIRRPDPVLTRGQLVEVVAQPWWDLRLPAEVTAADLPGYRELPGW